MKIILHALIFLLGITPCLLGAEAKEINATIEELLKLQEFIDTNASQEIEIKNPKNTDIIKVNSTELATALRGQFIEQLLGFETTRNELFLNATITNTASKLTIESLTKAKETPDAGKISTEILMEAQKSLKKIMPQIIEERTKAIRNDLNEWWQKFDNEIQTLDQNTLNTTEQGREILSLSKEVPAALTNEKLLYIDIQKLCTRMRGYANLINEHKKLLKQPDLPTETTPAITTLLHIMKLKMVHLLYLVSGIKP